MPVRLEVPALMSNTRTSMENRAISALASMPMGLPDYLVRGAAGLSSERAG